MGVAVTDRLDGTLAAEVHYPEGGIVFTNAYEADPVTVALTAGKTLSGRSLKAGEFSFQLTDAATVELVASAVNDGAGLVRFDGLELTEAGSYDFTISEVAGTEEGMEYDGRTFTVHVAVTDNGAGQLQAEVAYPDGGAQFKNVFTPSKDPGKPTNPDPGKPTVPQTGDDSPTSGLVGALGVLGASLAGLGAFLTRKLRRENA